VLRAKFGKVMAEISRQKYRDFWHRPRIRRVLGLTPERKASLGIRRTVRLVGNFPGLWQRTIQQTPGGSCQWGGTLFVAEGPADHYLVLNSLHAAGSGARVFTESLPAPERVWALHMEPEEYVFRLGYDKGDEHTLVSRFYTNSRTLLQRGGIYRPSPPYVHFHVGRSWDFLSTATVPRKHIPLGMITSDLRSLEGHRERLEFLRRLDESGLDYVLWGRGDGLRRFRNYRGFAASKWQAHGASRYSIVIENSVSALYWTEKVADALLAWSLPLYHGCPQIAQYLPEACVVPIDIGEANVIEQIRDVMARNEYDARFAAITAARRMLLQEQNFYAFINRELDAWQAISPPHPVA